MSIKKLPFFATAGKVLKSSIQELYKSFGFTLILSLSWFFAYLPVFFVAVILPSFGLSKLIESHQVGVNIFTVTRSAILVGMFMGSIINALWTGPLTTALYGLQQARKEEYLSFRLFTAIWKKVFSRSAMVHFIFSLVTSLFVFNILSVKVEKSIFFVVPAVLSICFLIFGCALFFYIHPLLYLNQKVKTVFKKAMLLTFDNTALSFFFGFVLVIFLLVSSVIPPLLLFVYGAFMIYIIGHGFDLIWAKYDE